MRPIKPLATHQTLTIVERSLDTGHRPHHD
nr:MAG TPA: hypothetical protein [Caudoviricetes sp.]